MHKRKVAYASADSTGFEAHHISHYFYRQRLRSYKDGKEPVIRRKFPKLSVIVDLSSHVILAAFGSRGPRPDVGQLEKTISLVPSDISIRTIVADAGYDSEPNHQRLRSRGIRSLIPPWHGRTRTSGNPPRGYWRKIMFDRFKNGSPNTYKKRWQVETVFSMLKRNLSPHLQARLRHSQNRELLLKILTHNTMILMALLQLFYRAYHLPFK